MSPRNVAARPRSERRRRRRRAVAVRWGVRLAIGLLAFGFGVAFGQATRDNPRPGGTITAVRTVPPGLLVPSTVTVTVTAPAG